MKISIFGTGYVGLVSGLGFAEMGHKVMCFDHDAKKIDQLNKKKVPLFEAKVGKLLKKHSGKNIHFTSQLETAVHFSDILFLCINLDSTLNGKINTDALFALIKKIKLLARKNKTVVLKSTVPIGTHRKMDILLESKKQSIKIDLITNPEFLSEGEAIQNFLNPYRIILGSDSPPAIKKLKQIYKPWLKKNTPLLEMDPTSAEMTKHAANCMLATRISFMNEISRLCELNEANIDEIKKGLALDPRIGSYYLNPGPGYGGSCLPKDIMSLIDLASKQNENLHLLKAVRKTNELQIENTFLKIKKMIKEKQIQQITIWGVSYKAGTDDIRQSAAVCILKKLLREKIKIKVFDPAALQNLKKLKLNSKLILTDQQYESLIGSDLLVILTDWLQFKKPHFKKMKAALQSPLVFDAKNIFDPIKMKAHGFTYHSLGRP